MFLAVPVKDFFRILLYYKYDNLAAARVTLLGWETLMYSQGLRVQNAFTYTGIFQLIYQVY